MSSVALQLFEERGFDQVTMAEIAEASSVSRRTLFRLFPSKSDIVWNGVIEIRDLVQQQAASLHGKRLPLRAILDELLVPVLRSIEEPEAAELARRRLRLIGSAPALLNQSKLREIEDALANVLASSGAPHTVPPSLVARTLVASCFAAVLWWAERGQGMTALGAARAALKSLARTGEQGL